MTLDPVVSFLIIAVVVIVLLSVFLSFFPIMLWISALASGVRIGIITLVAMRLRRVVPSRIVNPLIKATKAGLGLNINQLESHFLAGGNVDRVVNALIAAQRANIPLIFERAAAIDLAGRDVLQAVQMSVNPRVIETPIVAAVAKDGIMISRTVLGKGLDAGTAFEILSIDIADVDVGKNIGAHLQTEQAEADKKIAQAKAEERRAMAVAQEQENKAKVVEMEARVVESESQVPLAMAEALRSGKIGVMDYMNLKNIEADTQMRSSISKTDGPADGKDGR
ncbi:flotillin-like FloA family protein [Paenibacillus sp. MCAF20]